MPLRLPTLIDEPLQLMSRNISVAIAVHGLVNALNYII